MHRIILVGPAVEPVALADMKLFLRLDGDAEDGLVSALIVAARLAVEAATRLALVRQTWRLRLGAWPAGRRVAIPLAPVLAVEAVRVGAEDGGLRTLAPSLWSLDFALPTPTLIVGQAVPEPAPDGPGLEIDVACGFGPDAADVPEALRLAVRLLAARFFEHRGDEEASGEALPPPVRALLAPFSRPRLG
jgi:uncharacterized phiE125 gp8 family phage protein